MKGDAPLVVFCRDLRKSERSFAQLEKTENRQALGLKVVSDSQTMWHISGRGDKMILSLLKYQSPEYQPRQVKLDTTCARKALL